MPLNRQCTLSSCKATQCICKDSQSVFVATKCVDRCSHHWTCVQVFEKNFKYSWFILLRVQKPRRNPNKAFFFFSTLQKIFVLTSRKRHSALKFLTHFSLFSPSERNETRMNRLRKRAEASEKHLRGADADLLKHYNSYFPCNINTALNYSCTANTHAQVTQPFVPNRIGSGRTAVSQNHQQQKKTLFGLSYDAPGAPCVSSFWMY